MSSGFGAFAEAILARPGQLIRLPEQIDLGRGASFLQVYGTAWFALRHRTVVRPGEVVLVTGAGGGVGLAAVDVARSLGGWVMRHPQENRALIDEIVAAIAAGDLRPTAPSERRLEDAASVLGDLLERRAAGKIVLVP